MKFYSIMNADLAHMDEICADIKRQYEENIATLALFFVKLVPEGNPPVDKASLFAKRYLPFRDKLAEMGLRCGILVQCTIGHGYPLEDAFPYQPYVNLNDGAVREIVCPYDEGARAYFKDQFAKLASLAPASIMVDGDIRLLHNVGRGCACPLHMAACRQRLGADISREELFAVLKDRRHPLYEQYSQAFIDTQREAVVDAVRAMREGVDSVDPRIPGTMCNGGHYTNEFAAEKAKIFAGEGNPTEVRVHSGNYAHPNTRRISHVSYRLAMQGQMLKKQGVDVVLAEADTCPHNRYSTSAQMLHTMITATVLEGADGAKHWLTRLLDYEPNSGKAYRKKLAENTKFYEALHALYPKLKRVGCRIPFPTVYDYAFDKEGWFTIENSWATCVLERFGVPLYFSSEAGGAVFLEGDSYLYTDADILEMLKGPLFLASDTAQELIERGFGAYLGVSVEAWHGKNPSYERVGTQGTKCLAQKKIRALIPTSEATACDSVVYHLHGESEETELFPGVTVYRNALGGTVFCFAGSPNTPFTYTEAFAFLNETRKGQIARLLASVGCLPVCYDGDEEVYTIAAQDDVGDLYTVLFPMGSDLVEDGVRLKVQDEVVAVECLNRDGRMSTVPFTYSDGTLTVSQSLRILEPLVLKLVKKKG